MDFSKYINDLIQINRKYEFEIKSLGVSNNELSKYHVFHDEYDNVII